MIRRALASSTALLVWAMSATGFLATGCLSPAQERAERDLEVGQARVAGLSVVVAEGLACVRALEAGQIRLWQSAPQLTIDIQHEPGRVMLRVDNTMPDAQLSASLGAVNVVRVERPRTTSAVYQLEFAAAGTTRLSLESPELSPRPFRVALLSDVQEAIDGVQDIFGRMNQDPSIEFVLGAGDLTQQGSHAELARFERELELLERPYYATLGNHELGNDPPPFQARFGRASFSFPYRGARFTLLDSASATVDPLVLDWLSDWLTLGRDEFHLVGMHIPPVDPFGLRNGSFASRNEASLLFSLLQSGNVNLTVYGHIHSYYEFSNGGIPARISGGGGAIPERFDNTGRHFLTIDIDPLSESFRSAIVRIDG